MKGKRNYLHTGYSISEQNVFKSSHFNSLIPAVAPKYIGDFSCTYEGISFFALLSIQLCSDCPASSGFV